VAPNIPLKPLHSDEVLIPPKLAYVGALSTEELLNSLLPGQKDSLKVRPDGTILDGHHRIKVLQARAVAVDDLPREIITKEKA
jgi:hypothetical protein